MSDQTSLLTKQALDAAKHAQWDQAITLNEQLLTYQPDDVPTLNRLAFSYLQAKKSQDAKKTYQRVLDIDKHNSIAKKYSELLSKKGSAISGYQVDVNQDFVEEPGKTKVISLDRICDPHDLQKHRVASHCQLKPKGRYVTVQSHTGEYLGSLPEDISLHLSQLIRTGNQYDCVIKSVSKTGCAVFIKEKFRTEENQHISSFPTNKQSFVESDDEENIFGELLDEGTISEFKDEREEAETPVEDAESTEPIPPDVLGQVLR
jgi:tetratricopeptide (TPR) repeat protein